MTRRIGGRIGHGFPHHNGMLADSLEVVNRAMIRIDFGIMPRLALLRSIDFTQEH
jgi:hypothetical protein